MIEDYADGDCYLGFAKRVNIVPPDATKQSHGAIRGKLKVALGLGAIYGAGHETVARAGQMTEAEAKRYLSLHRETYRDFWEWRRTVVHHAGMHDEMVTPFGWRFWVGPDVTPTTAGNWPMQSAAGDMLRIATCLILEAGVSVVGVLHDAVMIEARLEDLDAAIETTVSRMQEASRLVLDGSGQLNVDVERIEFPNRFRDARGESMWARVTSILADLCDTPGGCA